MKTIKKMENDTFLEGMVAVSENNKTKNSLATASQINSYKTNLFIQQLNHINRCKIWKQANR